MNKKPLVSLIIVTMNHERFIEQACHSAILQTYLNLEIVLLDNNSSDDTFRKAKAVFDDCKIPHKLIQNTECFGVAKNLNILVSHTSGDFVVILSGDDWFPENSIEEKMKFVEANNVDFALSDGYRYLQAENKIIDAYSEKGKRKIIKNLSQFFHVNVTQNRPFNVGVIVKRELLVKYPFDEDIHAEDWDMNLRLTSLGYKIGFIDKKLFYYRILDNSLSKNWELMDISYKKITNKYLSFILSDKKLLKNYKINLVKHQYEILLSKNDSEIERKNIIKSWKADKYKIKYKQPVLFFKLFLLK